MDLSKYRQTDNEKKRTDDLEQHIKTSSKIDGIALDIGARDGHFSAVLAKYFNRVVALDLEKPDINHNKIECVKGDITCLDFDDGDFDLVFCAEVLEHIPKSLLYKATFELSRVSNRYIIVGVPYKQDIRVGRTTCYTCGMKNPPWGHINNFSEKKIKKLFPSYIIEKTSFVGTSEARTNFLSALLMDLAGNPYGTYDQDEVCINCGNKLIQPPNRNLAKKIFTKSSFWIQKLQRPLIKPHANWIHVLLRKK